MNEMVWKTGRITLFDGNDRPIAEVARVKGGWSYYVAGSDVGGDVETSSEAMAAVEQALGIKTEETRLS